ncbi:ABC transporter permease [Trichlorobacter ammonificans]|uniref:ABC transmembrane type-1 domain-containing protein n=1 Tax=Trichlorobacter ammonificans TaxID=2916410 RepID=A0ABM9DC30_9BACT|nr:ABC transporter permease subunit [Trichlorobacter ammonificans]CAH2031970.1 ABC transmembrane type-1 domain-containing protein [Trichlorobacter ammonificans]
MSVSGCLPAERRRPNGALLLCLPLLLLVLALLAWPLAHLLRQSLLLTDAPAAGLTLANYRELFAVPRYRHALLWSLELSLAVAAGSTLLCLAPAWLFTRYDFRGKRLMRAVLTLPMTFSGMIVGFLMVIMLGRTGFIPQLLEGVTGTPSLSGAAYRFPGLILAYLYFEIPRATLTLESALAKLDSRLEQAARSLGANRRQRLCLVVLPLIRPALLSTFALTFSVSLGSFGVLLVLSIRRFTLLPLEIFTQYMAPPSDHGIAAAMSLTLLAAAFGTGYGLRRLARRQEAANG